MAAVRSLRYVRWACVALAATLTIAESFAAGKIESCQVEAGRVVSRKGTVEVRRQGIGDWRPANLEEPLCDGDAVRTAARSRAALFIRPENIVRLDQNTAVSVRVTDDETSVDFFASGQVASGPDCGAGYFTARFPRKFKVRTQHVNAEIDGTEFLVRAACEATTIEVYEGAVRGRSLEGNREFRVEALQSITIGSAFRDSVPIRVQPRDSVQWTIRLITPDGAGASDRTCSGVQCEVLEAWDLLQAGGVREASGLLENVSRATNASADGRSLRAIVLLALGRREEAVAESRRAVTGFPDATNPWLAMSYAAQAMQDFDAALDASRQAVRTNPSSTTARARVAEVLLARGEIGSAAREAERAVEAGPDDPVALTARGFVRLANRQTALATQDFEKANGIESDDPRTHLGLGLAKLRAGEAGGGRRELETAAALDPTDANVRTYLGRAHLAVGNRARDAIAREQLNLALSHDPRDPTPHRYLALEARSRNAMAQAVEADQAAIALNRNRAILRTREVLTEDAVLRSLDAAATYREFGFERLARLEATKSILAAPGDSAAHRFFSSALSRSDREDPMRVSELLQSQLLQGIGAPLPSPSEPFTGMGRQPGSEALRPGLQEYSSVFDRTGNTARISALGGSRGTLSDEVSASHASDSMSIGFGQYYYRTNGIRANNDTTHRIHSVLTQWAVTPSLSILGEFRQRSTASGDIAFAGDPESFLPELRQSSRDRVARLGLRVSPGPATDVLVSLSRSEVRGRDFRSNPFLGGDIDTRTDEVGNYLDASVIHRFERGHVSIGASRYATSLTSDQEFIPGPCPFDPCNFAIRNARTNVHLYGTYRFDESISVLLGASHDRVRDAGLRIDSLNPKLGVFWSPTRTLFARLTTFQSVRPALIADQSLEPAQVLGQSQIFNDVVGTISQTRSVALDWVPTSLLHIGAEAARRKLRDPYDTFSATPYFSRPTEDRFTVHTRAAFGRGLSIGLEWNEERYTRPTVDADMFFLSREMRNRIVPLDARWFFGNGIVATGTVTRVRQEITSDYLSPGQDATTEFTLVDASVGYRLPGRKGFISLDVRNAFDRRFQFQDLNFLSAVPLTPRFLPSRTVFAKVVFFL